jgi:DNA polymerase-1
MNNDAQDVVFLDAYNLIYRAYHGNPNKLTNKAGIPTNAIYTVSRMLLKLPEQFNNLAYAVAVFDGGGNFRKELDSEYKANRKEMPEDLKAQMPYIKKVFELLGWPIMQATDCEADDVISTLAKRAAAKGFNTYILSSDKDFRQIITDNLHVIDTMQDICYDRETTKEKMGVYPENVPAWLALVGDTSDNVLGVDKVGKGTAPKLLEQYGSLQGIIDNKDLLKGKVGENIRTAIDNGQLLRSLELVTVKTDIEIALTKKDVRMKEIDSELWYEFCLTMDMKSLLNTAPTNQPK